MDFRPEKKLKSARGTLDYLRVSTYFNTSKKNQINDSHCGSSTQIWLNMLKIGMEISETIWNRRSRRWFTGGATRAPKCMPKALESSKDEICQRKSTRRWSALSRSPDSMHSGQLCLWGHQKPAKHCNMRSYHLVDRPATVDHRSPKVVDYFSSKWGD